MAELVERDGRWHIACCLEIPGANGQGRTRATALKSLARAIALILEARRKDTHPSAFGLSSITPVAQPPSRSI